MNLSRSKTLIGLLYAVILSLPLLNIAGRVLYTQWNKNAKDSYSGSEEVYIKQSTYYSSNEVSTLGDLVVGNSYRMDFNSLGVGSLNGGYSFTLNFDILSFGETFSADTTYVDGYYEDVNYSTFDLNYSGEDDEVYGINGYIYGFFGPSTSQIGIVFEDIDLDYLVLVFKGYLVDYGDIVTNVNFRGYSLYEYSVDSYVLSTISSLDNAFEYSIDKITDNNIGEVQFFTWFADLFLDLDNATNMLYVGFVNWYFNYALLVSLGYLMFMVLMWFVGLARKIFEKGQNFGEGGY